MRRLLWLSLLLTPIVLAAQGQVSGRATTDSTRVAALDTQWADSYRSHDTTFARRLFSADLVVTSASGALKDAEGELADIRPAPGVVVHSFQTSDVHVRVHGDAAIVTGLAEWSFTMGERTRTNRRRYTATYSRGGSLGWRMVALHLGAAPAPPGG